MFSEVSNVANRDLDIEAAFQATERSTRHNSKTFYFATAILPGALRRAIRALYAFCRATDDLVDKHGASFSDVEAWRAAAARPAHTQRDPLLLAWSLVRDRYGVDTRYQDELIDGIALDLVKRQYASWAELERYCYLVASTVGLLSMPILGLAKNVGFADAAPYGIRLGLALQLTNILRDVGEDAARGRVYLPVSDLAEVGLSTQDILDGVCDERFIALMKMQIARANALYDQALPGIALLSPAARPAVGVAAWLYRAILGQIEAIGYRVHSQRARTSGSQKLLMLPRILWQVFRLRASPVALEARGAKPCGDCA